MLLQPSIECTQAYHGLCLALQYNQLNILLSMKEAYYRFMIACSYWSPDSGDTSLTTTTTTTTITENNDNTHQQQHVSSTGTGGINTNSTDKVLQVTNMLSQIIHHLRNNYDDLWKWFYHTAMMKSVKDRNQTFKLMETFKITK